MFNFKGLFVRITPRPLAQCHNCSLLYTAMSEPKPGDGFPSITSLWYRRARGVLIGFASLYALAVILVMTPLIQTQFVIQSSTFFLADQATFSVLYAHYIDVLSFTKFNHPEHYGLARKSDDFTLGANTLTSRGVRSGENGEPQIDERGQYQYRRVVRLFGPILPTTALSSSREP